MAKLTATKILTTLDSARMRLWPRRVTERKLIGYFNADTIPSLHDPDTDSESASPTSLGLGYRWVKKPHDQLCDITLAVPGFIKTKLCYPLKASRKGRVESAADTEINKICHNRLATLITQLAGRAVITGRATAYRLSRYEWIWQSGHLLHERGASTDIQSDSFREWGFASQMTLRDLENFESRAMEDEGYGWSSSAIRALKKWIIEKTEAEKTKENATKSWEAGPLPDDLKGNPLDVYWFFKKNGQRSADGQEKIDLYCVSRQSGRTVVEETETKEAVIRQLKANTSEPDREQIIYYLKDAFDSVAECLIFINIDSRVDGDQEIDSMEGMGQIMINRLIAMEHLAGAMLNGVSFAVQPNLQITSGGQMADLEEIAKTGGLGPWDGVPDGVKVMEKNNALTGLNGAMNLINLIGVSGDQDAATGEISPYQQQHIELKGVAQQVMQQADAAVSRRMAKFGLGISQMAAQIVQVFCRNFLLWKKADPAYHEIVQFQLAMITKHGLMAPEFSAERLEGSCRAFAGGKDRTQFIQQSIAYLNIFGGQLAPAGHRYIAKEVYRAQSMNDAETEELFPEEAEQPVNQQLLAEGQEVMCFVSLQPPQRNPQDDPGFHALYHLRTLANRIQAAQQAGMWSPVERQGLQLLLQHTALDIPGLPRESQQRMSQALQQLARVAAGIQVSGMTTELMLKQQDAQRKMQELILKQEHEQNLVADRGAKHDLATQKLFATMTELNDRLKSSGVDRAGKLMDMATPANVGT